MPETQAREDHTLTTDTDTSTTSEPVTTAPREQGGWTKYTRSGNVPPVVGSQLGGHRGPSPSERAFGESSEVESHDEWGREQQPGPKLGRMARRRLGREGRQEKVLQQGHDIPNQHVILEQLAHRGAYERLDTRNLEQWGYREAGAVADPESGFRSVLYLPTEEALSGATERGQIIRMVHGGAPPPVVAFRGTNEKRGVQDDTTKAGVGAYQFASNQHRVAQLLDAAGGRVVTTGHSLGGALAQLAATHFPAQVGRVVTFQSPGIPKEEAAKVKAYNEANPNNKVESTHHRMDGDLVHMAGTSLTEGSVYTFHSAGIDNPLNHMNYPLARLAAARGDMIPGVNDGLDKKGGDQLTSISKETTGEAKSGILPSLSEGARKGLGGAVRDKTMDKYVKVWNLVKEMIDSRAFGPNYVLGVIASSPDLTDDQKVKMRDAAKVFLAQQQETPTPTPEQPKSSWVRAQPSKQT